MNSDALTQCYHNKCRQYLHPHTQIFRKPYFCKVPNNSIAKLIDFLKFQPERPNTNQALVAWIYAFLLKESQESLFINEYTPKVDASFPVVNTINSDMLAHNTVSISTPDFLLEIVLLDAISTKNQTKTVIQAIANLEAIMSFQHFRSTRNTNNHPLSYLLLLSKDPKQAYSELPQSRNDKNQLFSLHHGSFYGGQQSGFYHGKDMLQLKSRFEFEWRFNREADYHFCLTELKFPIDFKNDQPTAIQKSRLELPRGTYRNILADIAQHELNHRTVSVQELIELFSKYTEHTFRKQLDSPEFRDLSVDEKEQLLSLAMNSFQGKGNSGACYAQIHIHTINDKHRIHFGGIKTPTPEKNLFVILNPPNENESKYGRYKQLKITAFIPEKHKDYDIYFGKKDDIQKILS